MKRLLVIIALSIFIFSCNKDEEMPEPSHEYLVFGHYYGFCGGEECIEIFKLENGKLFEDIEDDYPLNDTPYNATFEQLHDTSYQKVAELADYFPQKLYTDGDTVFGIPDAYDQGGLYIERKTEDEFGFWRIDQDTTNIPAFLHEFHAEVNAAIDRINNQ